jgi:hypothetical protein
MGSHNFLDRAALHRDVGEEYASVLALFRIPTATSPPQRGRSPRGESPSFDEGSGYSEYVRLPIRQTATSEVREMPLIDGGVVRMRGASGATISIDVATGNVSAPDVPAEDARLIRIWRR